ncbi:hypothetical protein [Hyalangium minutum]|uniref:Lipoprotein n=1 Tax=Hyalangium minutum TaxID=394096 RepID=A0A085WSM6_9BACT|nr:hypothetical protein [Hyalangium minutum]KFE70689.1 hypothetical protein DB31_5731 [Hyalangium minutum]
MKKLTGALVLSLSLLMTSACRSAGETRDSEDASTPAADAQAPGNTVQAGVDTLQKDAGSQDDAGSATVSPTPAQGLGAGAGSSAGKASAGSSYAATLTPAEKQAQEACIDTWLKGKKLDRYGHDEGTMYAGGSPIFNEMTGEARERLDYVYERQPEAKKACTTAAQSTPQNKKGIPEKKK